MKGFLVAIERMSWKYHLVFAAISALACSLLVLSGRWSVPEIIVFVLNLLAAFYHIAQAVAKYGRTA